MQPNRYHVAFYDILPSAGVLTELPPFPGALRLGDIEPEQRLKVVHSQSDGFSWNREAILTVTDHPFKDRKGEYFIEVVFDRHVAAKHPNLEPGEYKSCCYQTVRAADLGLTTYNDGRWNQTYYCTEHREEED